MTSSNIKTQSLAEVASLNNFKKSSCPGTKPIFPAIGSTITAAKSSFISLNISKNCSLLLYSQLNVYFAKSAGTPGESGKPKVATPEPALIRRESTWP